MVWTLDQRKNHMEAKSSTRGHPHGVDKCGMCKRPFDDIVTLRASHEHLMQIRTICLQSTQDVLAYLREGETDRAIQTLKQALRRMEE